MLGLKGDGTCICPFFRFPPLNLNQHVNISFFSLSFFFFFGEGLNIADKMYGPLPTQRVPEKSFTHVSNSNPREAICAFFVVHEARGRGDCGGLTFTPGVPKASISEKVSKCSTLTSFVFVVVRRTRLLFRYKALDHWMECIEFYYLTWRVTFGLSVVFKVEKKP
jgi:hypothetical protein